MTKNGGNAIKAKSTHISHDFFWAVVNDGQITLHVIYNDGRQVPTGIVEVFVVAQTAKLNRKENRKCIN